MADKRKPIIREDNSDSSVHCWHIPYEVEDGSDKNNFVIVVKASEMTVPTSESEAKTLADAKAATMKSDWVTVKTTATTNTETTSTDENVTL